MKVTIFGLLAIAAVAQAGVVQFLPAAATHLVRTPSLDSAVIQSDRLNGAFSYSTVENHAYAPVVQSVPVYRTYSYYPQVPQIYYSPPPPIYSIHPSYIPTWSGIPLPAPAPGVNPQNPVEVESPADNAVNEFNQSAGNQNDEDTVSVDSA